MRLRLIDVQDRVIKSVGQGHGYVAVSHGWGSRSREYVTGRQVRGIPDATRDPAVQPSRLLPEDVPRTVEDAIEVVKALGETYLWTDFYCIDLDNEKERQLQIENMHLVYQGAHLTLIALDGENLESGLSGVSKPLQQTLQPHVSTPYGQFMAIYVSSTWDNFAKSPSDKRAWTL
jgi:Heterokaryon incompatibility protein (HET)